MHAIAPAFPATGSVPADTAPEPFLTFQLDRELFGVGIRTIREIIEYRTPTDVPMMPPALRGVINLRGAVVPVVDLAQRFGRPASTVTRRSCIVILEVTHGGVPQVLGLLVDAVSEVREIAAADIAAPPGFGAGLRRDFIRGMGRIDDRFVVLLDTHTALDLHDVSARADAADAVAIAA